LQVAIYESELRDGESAWAQGNKSYAVSLFEKALARAREIAAGEPDSGYRQREVALVLTRLVPTYEAVERLDASVTAAVDAATIMQRLFAADPTNESMRSGAMITAGWAARQLLKTSRFEEAALYIETDMKFARQRLAAAPDDAESQASVALAHRRAGILAYRRGLFAEATREHEKARALQVKFRHNAPESRMAAALSLSYIARAELAAGRIDSARDSIALALTEMRTVVAEKPTTRFKDDLIDTLDLQSDAFMAIPQDRRRAKMALSEALEWIDAEAKRRTLASSELRLREAITAKLARK
jgi:tetratricopeptide (TPR) repeat protein